MEIEGWIEECSCRFRELWNLGMRDKTQLANALRATHSRVVRIVPVPHSEGFSARA